ncbi:hypothetical protein B0H14DRAFT_2828707 [Mycena olivaceomarginata]|nr:hypothetical protein B0H14DRAFT_2828707 [Mycena olivaceomarginata]
MSMFSGCNNFTIHNGIFNLTHGDAKKHNADFRSIRVGDLNLIECIVTDEGVDACRRLRIGAGNRRVYHARVVGCQDTIFTAVVYDGPHFARVTTLALVPACQVLARCKSDLSRAYTLYHIVSNHSLSSRLSTLILANEESGHQFQRSWRPKIKQWFCVPDQVYTEWMKLLADPRWWPTNPNPLPTSAPLLHYIENEALLTSFRIEDLLLMLVLHFPTFVHELSAWEYLDTNGIPIYDLGTGEMIFDDWTRITLQDFEQYEGDACRIHHFACKIELKFLEDIQKWWLAQATQVLGEQSASEYCEKFLSPVLATGVVFYVSIWFPPTDEFSLRGTFMADAPPKELYLFLLNPRADIQYDRSSVEIPAACDSYYWSFESDGSHRVLDEVLEEIVPPRVLFHPRILGHRWLQSDYRLVTEFQLAEACDPGTTGLAKSSDILWRFHTINQRRLICTVSGLRMPSIIAPFHCVATNTGRDWGIAERSCYCYGW